MRWAFVISFLLVGGCISYEPPPPVDTSTQIEAEKHDLTGRWIAKDEHGDPWNYPGIDGLVIRPDGTGFHLSSTIFKSGDGKTYWIYRARIEVRQNKSGQWEMSYAEKPVTLEGGGSFGLQYTRPQNVPLVLTPRGLVIDRARDNAVYYSRFSANYDEPLYPLISEEIAKRRQRMMLGTYAGKSTAGASENDSNLHAAASAFQIALGAAALADGNNAAANVAFQNAQRQSMAGLRGDEFDSFQAGKDAFLSGAAIGSDGRSVPSGSLEKSVADVPSKGSRSAAESEGTMVAQVTVDSQMMTAYTDGMAYDVLTLVPQPGSAGEFAFFFGVPRGNAASLLANGFSAAGTNSAYGPGNPQQQISYRAYPVREGQTIRYGREIKTGQVVKKPPDYTAQAVRPLR